MNADRPMLHTVKLIDGRTVNVMSSPDQLTVRDVKGVDMTIAHHLEAVTNVYHDNESPCIRPNDKVALESFKYYLTAVLKERFQSNSRCYDDEIRGMIEGFDEAWMFCALRGDTPREIASNLGYARPTKGGGIQAGGEDSVLGSVEQLKIDLLSTLGASIKEYESQDIPHGWLMEKSGDFGRIYWNTDIVSFLIDEWLGQVCGRVEMSRAISSPYKVTLEWLPRRLQGGGFFSDLRFDPDLQDIVKGITGGMNLLKCDTYVLVNLVAALYPVDDLFESLIRIKCQLDVRTCENSAYRLGDVMGFFYRSGAERSEQKNMVTNRCGRFVRAISYKQKNKMSRIMFLNDLADKACVFERYAGVKGLRACIDALITAESQVDDENRVSGRPRLCSGMSVEVIVFKEKLEIRFESAVFEALVGFIKEHHHLMMPPLESR